ncbi:MazG-like family protein [Virgibacillus kimchii]
MSSKEKPSMTILPEHISKLNSRTKIINDINDERSRQNYKWGEQHHSYDTWYTILGEEFGEVAQAIQTDKHWGKNSDKSNLYKELIQVAAVSVAIAEQVLQDE